MRQRRSKLRSYVTEGRALAYVRILQKRFPRAEFEVRLSPFAAYPFRYLILYTKGGGGNTIGGAWVSR